MNIKTIKKSLISALDRKGNNTPYFADLVDNYIEMVKTKNALQKDINKRGVSVEKVMSDGRVLMTKNDSVGDLVKVNAQMIKQLCYLGIRPEDAPPLEDDEL